MPGNSILTPRPHIFNPPQLLHGARAGQRAASWLSEAPSLLSFLHLLAPVGSGSGFGGRVLDQ